MEVVLKPRVLHTALAAFAAAVAFGAMTGAASAFSACQVTDVGGVGSALCQSEALNYLSELNQPECGKADANA
jgi:hypothetical protein